MPTLLVIHKLAAALGTILAALMAAVEVGAPPADEPPALPLTRAGPLAPRGSSGAYESLKEPEAGRR